MSETKSENARMLASLLGASEEEAAQLLERHVLLTFDAADVQATILSEHVLRIVGRTVSTVSTSPTPGVQWAAELVIGGAVAATRDAVRLIVTDRDTQAGRSVRPQAVSSQVHPLLLVVAACYATARLMVVMFGDRLNLSALPADRTLVVPHRSFLGEDGAFLTHRVELGETHLAGAGAIGNAVVFALTFLNVGGTLRIVDPKNVSEGNLNRCLLFDAGDVGRNKAERLAEKIAPLLPNVTVIPHAVTLQDLAKTHENAAWLRKVIVGVDSRRVRRHIQGEIPREVFDASTTGAEDAVFHYHIQPTGEACLACIYHEHAGERDHEAHVAEALGVTLADVQEHFVSPRAAVKISARYPAHSAESLVGKAYDTLFKAMCGAGTLRTPEGRQVLAPFAFVSVLAGVNLVIQLARQSRGDQVPFNYWRVSPWNAPVEGLKDRRLRHPHCDFCSEPAKLRVAKKLWALPQVGA